MKLRNIFITGLSALALASCSDYLDVDAPSQNVPEYVFSDKTEMNNALTGIYASMASGDSYGDKIFSTYVMNTDVDFKTNSSRFLGGANWYRYDADPDGGAINSTWKAQYATIELCNLFVEGAESSPLYNPDEKEDYADIRQMIGEAKVVRAIVYHDLVWMFGDPAFSFNSSRTTDVKVYPIMDRAEVLDKCIADLEEIADDMKYADELPDGVERISKEMAWAMIARIAQTAAGYTLRPEGETYGKMVRMNQNYLDYYAKARDYAYKVMESGKHKLSKQFYKVFYDECNYIVDSNDDVIWEMPFGKTASGKVGYSHGVKLDSYQSETPHNYGEAKSDVRLNALYRFMFNENDVRRDYVNQLTKYDAPNGDAIIDNTYTVSNGKWSKLWVTGGLGNQTTDKTGINFPMMRYADVLLMYAEAVNEISGVTSGDGAKAVDALVQVRKRAFPNNPELCEPYVNARLSQEDFRKAVLDERKFEFAGENMRWRDLVRHNLLAENVYWTFYRYLSIAEASESSSPNLGHVSAYDFDGNDEAYDKFPYTYRNVRSVDNKMTVDGVEMPIYAENVFPNQSVKVCRILNPYRQMSSAEANSLGLSNLREDLVEWSKDGQIRNEIRFSLRGYIYMTPEEGNEDGPGGVVVINNNGKFAMDTRDLASKPDASTLPVIRYILPIPRAVIARSQGQYKNQYGYK